MGDDLEGLKWLLTYFAVALFCVTWYFYEMSILSLIAAIVSILVLSVFGIVFATRRRDG